MEDLHLLSFYTREPSQARKQTSNIVTLMMVYCGTSGVTTYSRDDSCDGFLFESKSDHICNGFVRRGCLHLGARLVPAVVVVVSSIMLKLHWRRILSTRLYIVSAIEKVYQVLDSTDWTAILATNLV